MNKKIDWNNYIDVRDNLISLQSNNERRKVLYKWLRGRLISFDIFDKLIYYVT